MKPSRLALLLLAAVPASSLAQSVPSDTKELATAVFKLFDARCAACHSPKAKEEDRKKNKSEEFYAILDFAKLRASKDFINLDSPAASGLFEQVDSGDMPKATAAQKAAKEKVAEFTADEKALVLAWLKAGAPDAPPEVVAAAAAPAVAASPAPGPVVTKAASPADLAQKVHDLFKNRCASCHDQATHGTSKGKFGFVMDFARMRTDQRFILPGSPQASPIYTRLTEADAETRMPFLTKAEKDKGLTDPEPLKGEEISLVLEWLNAGAPDVGAAPSAPVVADNGRDSGTPGVPVSLPRPAPVDPAAPASSVPPPPPAVAERKVIKEADAMDELYSDLRKQDEHDRRQVRYISILPQYNNTSEISDAQLETTRAAVIKVLNSLSTDPQICKPEQVGPGKAFFRFKLDDVGWDEAMWEHIISFYPYALEDSRLGNEAGTSVPVLRADWLATNATRPPLYNHILKLPKTQQELERQLGVDVHGNLMRYKAVRAGFSKSGISRFNRMVERHELGTRPGYYWLSYDFAGDDGQRNLLTHPLGPIGFGLAGGKKEFEHDGGEIIFSLPNGFQGYYLSTSKGTQLDIAPTTIVGDTGGVTGRPDVVNGLSCMICHSGGMKEQPGNTKSVTDLVRAVAKGDFTAAEEEAILRLYPEQKVIDDIIAEDRATFKRALEAAGIKQGSVEPVGALSMPFEEKLTMARAAAELGFTAKDFEAELRERDGFGIERVALSQGGMSRGAFAEKFPELAGRLGVGTFRRPTAFSNGTVDVLREQAEKRQPRPILFELRADRNTYRGGDPVNIAIQSEKQGHLRLFYKDAHGKVYTIFPTETLVKDAKAQGVAINDVIPGGKPVVISGPNSITGTTVYIRKKDEPGEDGKRDAVFGKEQIGAVITDFPLDDDAEFLAQLENSGSIEKAVSFMAAQATKSARSRLNATGAATTSGGGDAISKPRIGIQIVNITTLSD